MSFDFSEESLHLEPQVTKKIKKNPVNDEDSYHENFNYISALRGNRKTRGKIQDPKENLLYQIDDQPLFWKCIPHPKLVEYLLQNKYYDIDDYVKYCNKKGILFDVPIKQYYAEPIEYPKYNQYQMMEIHKKNKIQRQLENMMVEVRQLKTQKDTPKAKQPNNLIKFYDPKTISQEFELQEKIKNQRNLGRTIKQLKQQNSKLVDSIKQIYEEYPLDQPIAEGLIEDRMKHFVQCKLDMVKGFQPIIKQKEISQGEEIDYDELSDDSLDTICAVHPKDRVGFKTLYFFNRVQVIGTIHLTTFDSQIQQII